MAIRVNDVSAGQGGAWIAAAFGLLRAQPFQWIALTALWFLVSLLLSALPIVGLAAASILQPVFIGGMMLAARDQEAGKAVSARHLFAAFSVNARGLMMVGTVSLFVFVLAQLFLAMVNFPQIKLESFSPEQMQAARNMLEGHGWKIAVVMAALGFTNAILWFTAPLLVFHSMSGPHAIRWSAYALFSNPLPALCFATFMLVILFIGAIPWGLGIIVVIPLLTLCHYTSYKNVFTQSESN